MRLSISNLAWDTDNFRSVISHCKRFNMLVECILSQPQPHNLELYACQAIFHNSGIQSLADPKAIHHLLEMIKLAKDYKLKVMVLGAGQLRTGSIPSLNCIDEALDGITLCIEPNAKKYGGQYFTRIEEICHFIDGFKNIKTMIDTHNLLLEDTDPVEAYKKYEQYIAHIHVSENNLGNFKKSNIHVEFAKLLKSRYSGVVTYEVRSNPDVMNGITDFVSVYQ